MTTWIELNEGVLYDAESLATAVFSSFIFDCVRIEYTTPHVEINISGQISRSDLESKRGHELFHKFDELYFPEYVKLFKADLMTVYLEITGFWDDEEDSTDIDGLFTITAEQITNEANEDLNQPIEMSTIPSKDYSTPAREERVESFRGHRRLRAIHDITVSMLVSHDVLSDEVMISKGDMWLWDFTSFDGSLIEITNEDDETFFVDPLWFEGA